jgi:hypothetical protein
VTSTISRRADLADAAGGLHALLIRGLCPRLQRQHQAHQHYVGDVLDHSPHSALGIAGLAHEDDIQVSTQVEAQPFQHHVVVVHHEDSDVLDVGISRCHWLSALAITSQTNPLT